jgi:hypothetical protein
LHVLTERDVLESRPQRDAVAYGGWPIDTHPPDGIDAPAQPPCEQHPVPYLYDIPLRCLVSEVIANLMFAGRNMSATHVGIASTRVMATCAAKGQGAGTAAAYAAAHRRTPAEVVRDDSAIRAIQQRLLRDDCYLIGVANSDPRDHARDATITASSAQAAGPAIGVISGQTRAVHGPRGAPPERARRSSHRWMSDPRDGFPAWLELRWNDRIPIGMVQLIFDTGLHRVLTLSHSDQYVARMCWGRPQPETARDYELLARVEDRWQRIAQVRDNSQRLRRHHLPNALLTNALRVSIHATHGIDHARICEVRVYGSQEDHW